MLSSTHPNVSEVTSTLFYTIGVSKDKNNPINHSEAQLCPTGPGALPQGSLMKGAPKMDGTMSKSLAPPHTHHPFVKRKGQQGTFRYSGLRLSSILVYSACPKSGPQVPPSHQALLPGQGFIQIRGLEPGASFSSQTWAHSNHLCIFGSDMDTSGLSLASGNLELE